MAKQGLISGLSYRHDFDSSINNIYKQEEMFARQRIEKERKSKYYEELLREPNVLGEGVKKKLKGHTEKVIDELAEYHIQNPDWETDATKYTEARKIIDKIVNNPIVQTDLQVRQAKEALNKDLELGNIDEDDYYHEAEKYEAYLNDESEDADPYVYIRPVKVSYNDILKDASGLIGTDTGYNLRGDGEYHENYVRARQKSIESQVQTDLNNPKFRKEIERNYKLEGGEILGTVAQYHEKKIKATLDSQKLLAGSKSGGSGGDGVTAADVIENSRFIMDTDGLRDAIISGSHEYKSAALSANLALTDFKEQGQRTQLTEGMGLQWYNPNSDSPRDNVSPFKSTVVDTKTGKINGVPARVTDAGSILTIKGVPYVETVFTVQIPKDNKTYYSELKNQGFAEVSDWGGDFLANFGKEGVEVITMQGTLLSEARLDAENQVAYDDALLGAEQMKKLQTRTARRVYESLEQDFASSKELQEKYKTRPDVIVAVENQKGTKILPDKDGYWKGVDEKGEFVVNPDTGEIYRKKQSE